MFSVSKYNKVDFPNIISAASDLKLLISIHENPTTRITFQTQFI